MRIAAARAPSEPGWSAVWAYHPTRRRLQHTQQETLRRSIRTSSSIKQSAHVAAAAEHEEAEAPSRYAAKRPRPSWGIGRPQHAAAFTQWQNTPLADTSSTASSATYKQASTSIPAFNAGEQAAPSRPVRRGSMSLGRSRESYYQGMHENESRAQETIHGQARNLIIRRLPSAEPKPRQRDWKHVQLRNPGDMQAHPNKNIEKRNPGEMQAHPNKNIEKRNPGEIQARPDRNIEGTERPLWRRIRFADSARTGSPHQQSTQNVSSIPNHSPKREHPSRQSVLDPWSLPIPSRRAESANRLESNKVTAANESNRPSSIRWPSQQNGEPRHRGDRTESSFTHSRREYREDRAEKSDRVSRQKARQNSRNTGRSGRQRDDDDDMDASLADRIESKRARKAARKRTKESQAAPTPIVLPEFISVGNLATALKVRVEEFTGKLKELGFEEVLVDHIIDAETAGLVASEFNFEPTLPKEDVEQDLMALPEPDDKSLLPNRPPVITIMGHVDHGKTTLLDWLRKSSVVATEHGGITQHIGAFTVPMPSGRTITFLDTPGHAAFLSMRARGANVTDIVILVVAADDSVKPQTLEAIKHAKDAQVPIIVAINKIDKSAANAQRVKEDLARHGVEVEAFGGDVQTVEVSGKTGAGMDALEEAAMALSDVLDVRAPNDGPVEGWVLESSAKRAGKVATVLVRRGTLETGTVLVAGKTWTRVRTLTDANGVAQESVGPGIPTVVDGWREQPEAGEEVLQASDEQRAKRAVSFREEREEAARLAQDVIVQNQARSEETAAEAAAQAQAEATGEDAATLREAAAQTAAQSKSGVLELPIVLRADVSGSVEAVDAYIQSLSSPRIQPKILRALVGPATSSDVKLAELTNGVLVSFNVNVPSTIALAAERGSVPMISGNVIYRLADDVKAEMERRLPEKISTKVLGEAEVLQIFNIGLGGGKGKLPVAGVRVGNGIMKRGGRVRVLRGGKNTAGIEDIGTRKGASKHAGQSDKQEEERVVHDGHIGTLRSHQKEVAEIRKGSECGISFDGGFSGFEVGDRVQLYEEIREKQTL